MNDHRRDATDGTALDERVALLLSAAAAPSEPGPLPGEGAALAAYRASVVPTRRRSMLTSIISAKAAVAAVLGSAALLTGGVAAATAGVLPGAAQDTAREILGNVGFDVPGADDAGIHPHMRGASDQAPAGAGDDTDADADGTATDSDDTEAVEGEDDVEAPAEGKGETISQLARSEETRGIDKGKAVSEEASEGRSQAGDHGRAEAPEPPAGSTPTTERGDVDEAVESEPTHDEQVEVEPSERTDDTDHRASTDRP